MEDGIEEMAQLIAGGGIQRGSDCCGSTVQGSRPTTGTEAASTGPRTSFAATLPLAGLVPWK